MKKKGFTLIELLAVIIILAILLVIAVPQILKIINASIDNAWESNVKMIKHAITTNSKMTNPTTGTYYTSPQLLCENETTTDKVVTNNIKTIVKVDSTTIACKKDTDYIFTLNGKKRFNGKKATITCKADGSCTHSLEGASIEPNIVAKPISFATDPWDTIKHYPTAYNVGDTRNIQMDLDGDGTKETYQIRIANISSPAECANEGFSQTGCGLVIDFTDLVGLRPMNPTSTNKGGWKETEMRSYLNGEFYNKLPKDLQDAIIETYPVVSGSGKAGVSDDTRDKIFLLSRREINNDYDYDNKRDLTRILDYYLLHDGRVKKPLANTDGTTVYHWWLRSARSNDDTNFLHGGCCGDMTARAANNYGVLPAFRIATTNIITESTVLQTKINDDIDIGPQKMKQTVKISDTGKYKLEVWGASGGNDNPSSTYKSSGGYGGYSVGFINLQKDDILYVYVGGQGVNTSSYKGNGGYNGGADSYNGGSGGGATHISKAEGTLSELSDNKSSILIVAGGGGGANADTDGSGYNTNGGNAGGYIGNSVVQIEGSCTSSCTKYNYPSGGTQDNGGIGVTSWSTGNTSSTQYVGTFGKGATGKSSYGGGGGGYFGGASGQHNAGGGGSSYLSPLLTDAAMYCYDCEENNTPSIRTIKNNQVSKSPVPTYSKIGNGYARITFIGEE